MKTYKILYTMLVSLLVLVVVSGCRQKGYQEPEISFKVVKTEYPASYAGGKGFIDLSEAGFAYSIDADWLTVTHASPTRLELSIPQNESPETRATVVRLVKDGVKINVVVSQLGVVNDIRGLKDFSFGRMGGEMRIETELQSIPEVILTGDDTSWVETLFEGNQMVIKVAALPASVDLRSLTLSVVAGLMHKTITITQNYGMPLYTDLLGEWILTYRSSYGGDLKEHAVTLAQNIAGRSYKIVGLQDIILEYDANTGMMKIPTQHMPGGDADDYLWAWLAGVDDLWNLWRGSDWYFEGKWDKNIDTPKFVFTCPTEGEVKDKPNKYRPIALAFYNSKKGEWVSGVTIGAFADFTLTKKAK